MAAAARERKAARRDTLRLDGLRRPVDRHLLRHNTPQVTVDRHDVDGGQPPALVAQLERTAVAAAVQGEFPCPICFGGWPDGQDLATQLLAADEERAVLPAHIIRLPRRQRSALASRRPGRPLAANQTDRHAPLLHRQPDAQIRLLLYGLAPCHSRLSRNRRLPRHGRGRG